MLVTSAEFAAVKVLVVSYIRDDVATDGEQFRARVTDCHVVGHCQEPFTHSLADWVPA